MCINNLHLFFSCPSKKVENQLIKGFVEERSDGFSAKLKVFRFDGSRRVRIRCAINICIERCEPVSKHYYIFMKSLTYLCDCYFRQFVRAYHQIQVEVLALVGEKGKLLMSWLIC